MINFGENIQNLDLVVKFWQIYIMGMVKAWFLKNNGRFILVFF